METFSIADGQSGRLEMAHWLADVDQGAVRLVARVLANRVWHHLIGRGLVRTVDNFGRTGEPPSHPELLDHLAAELIDSGWSIKSLVRTIVSSRTFAMSSHHDPEADAVDPDNRLLWRSSPTLGSRVVARRDAVGCPRTRFSTDGINGLVPG